MQDAAQNKQAALAELQARATLGREILLRPIVSESDLEQSQQARIEWGLGNKKLLHQIFGEAAGQVRFSASGKAEEMPFKPKLEDFVREFQQVMITQISDLEKLIHALSRMP
ncbi:MAG: hypothetical protein VKP62_09355 [Candidatus Sericytochromatia bacterium]|nr:hypothetical protein [Candidatus Sericytochromatia bacterium]